MNRTRVSWTQFHQMTHMLADSLWMGSFDAIVPLPRGGLILGVCLSHLLHDTPIVVPNLATDGQGPPNRISLPLDHPLMKEPRTPISSVLIVDDVASFGRLISLTVGEIQEHFPQAEIVTATLFADVSAISRGHWASLLPDLHYVETVDNAVTWIEFPWEVDAHAPSDSLPQSKHIQVERGSV